MPKKPDLTALGWERWETDGGEAFIKRLPDGFITAYVTIRLHGRGVSGEATMHGIPRAIAAALQDAAAQILEDFPRV